MVFLGKSVHLSHDDAEFRDEIKVYQQHCGGENLCVFKGKLLEGGKNKERVHTDSGKIFFLTNMLM